MICSKDSKIIRTINFNNKTLKTIVNTIAMILMYCKNKN